MNRARWWLLVMLTVGILVIAYGHLQQNGVALAAGLLVILGGVMFGVIQIVIRQN